MRHTQSTTKIKQNWFFFNKKIQAFLSEKIKSFTKTIIYGTCTNKRNKFLKKSKKNLSLYKKERCGRTAIVKKKT